MEYTSLVESQEVYLQENKYKFIGYFKVRIFKNIYYKISLKQILEIQGDNKFQYIRLAS